MFQIWSDQPIDVLPAMSDGDSEQSEDDDTGPEPGRRHPPDPWFHVQRPPGPPPPGPPGPGAPEDRPRSTTGELVIRSSALAGADLPRLDAPAGRPRFETITLPDGSPGRAAGLRLQPPLRGPGPHAGSLPKLTVVVAAGTAEIEKQLGFLAALLAATALGTMAVSGGVAWLVVSRGLHPLGVVADKIAAMDETGLKKRIADQGVPREIEPLVHQLNELLGRLDEAFERERALTADVAHELRTPVAEIRAIAEVTLSRMRDPQEYRRALGEMEVTITTLQGLIEKLLTLARLEAGQVKPELTTIPLKPLVVEHWAVVHSKAEERGLTLEDQCPPESQVEADPKLLDVVLANALANAARYASEGTRIIADIGRAGTRPQFILANAGCRLTGCEVARVFDRFWRADAARSKTGLNCGLGLTLVRRAMEAMGGSAQVSVNDDSWFTLTLTFPSAKHSNGTRGEAVLGP